MTAQERRPRRAPVTAAALLPACLLGAVLVAAPFAGTTTRPLTASSHPLAAPAAGSPHAGHATGTQSGAATSTTAATDTSVSWRLPAGSVATLGVAYTAIGGIGAGVLVAVRRRRTRETRD